MYFWLLPLKPSSQLKFLNLIIYFIKNSLAIYCAHVKLPRRFNFLSHLTREFCTSKKRVANVHSVLNLQRTRTLSWDFPNHEHIFFVYRISCNSANRWSLLLSQKNVNLFMCGEDEKGCSVSDFFSLLRIFHFFRLKICKHKDYFQRIIFLFI